MELYQFNEDLLQDLINSFTAIRKHSFKFDSSELLKADIEGNIKFGADPNDLNITDRRAEALREIDHLFSDYRKSLTKIGLEIYPEERGITSGKNKEELNSYKAILRVYDLDALNSFIISIPNNKSEDLKVVKFLNELAEYIAIHLSSKEYTECEKSLKVKQTEIFKGILKELIKFGIEDKFITEICDYLYE